MKVCLQLEVASGCQPPAARTPEAARSRRVARRPPGRAGGAYTTRPIGAPGLAPLAAGLAATPLLHCCKLVDGWTAAGRARSRTGLGRVTNFHNHLLPPAYYISH